MRALAPRSRSGLASRLDGTGRPVLRAISASRSRRTFASVRLRSIDVPLRMAGQRTPGHCPVVSSIFALTTRNPLVLSAAANSAAVIWGRRGAAPRGFFIFNVFPSGSDYQIGAVGAKRQGLFPVL